jgi:hypothetical protein
MSGERDPMYVEVNVKDAEGGKDIELKMGSEAANKITELGLIAILNNALIDNGVEPYVDVVEEE